MYYIFTLLPIYPFALNLHHDAAMMTDFYNENTILQHHAFECNISILRFKHKSYNISVTILALLLLNFIYYVLYRIK